MSVLTGNGAEPVPGMDAVSGNIIINVNLAGSQYTVSHGTSTDPYAISGGPVTSGTSPSAHPKYAWSKKSQTYHFTTCDYVKMCQTTLVAKLRNLMLPSLLCKPSIIKGIH